MKYRKFAGRIGLPTIRKIFEKRSHFFGRHVDVHKGKGGVRLMWMHVDRGRGVKNPIFVWTS